MSGPSKCFLMQRSVHYLGHVVSAKGVETDPKKVSCVWEWPIPTDVKELQQFLGLASYYRRFVKNFAHKARPLYRLTEKGRRWNWTDGLFSNCPGKHQPSRQWVNQKTQNPSSPALRQSTRLRRPPERYGTVVSFRDSDSELEN